MVENQVQQNNGGKLGSTNNGGKLGSTKLW